MCSTMLVVYPVGVASGVCDPLGEGDPSAPLCLPATHGGTPPRTVAGRGVLCQGGDVPRVRSAPR